MSKLTQTVDLAEIKTKLYERLKLSGWHDKLKTFILSQDFDNILKALLKDAQEGRRFTPVLKQVFRAFEECPYDKLKVVMIVQDPYIQANIADGIALSCGNTGTVETPLKYMFKEIEDTIHKKGYTGDPDLARWSNQGILMLNVALTTNINKVGSHYLIWQPFIAFLLDILTFQNPGLIYVFLGKKAESWAPSIPENNYKLFATHPASAVFQELDRWDSGDLFNKISNLIEKNFNEKLVW